MRLVNRLYRLRNGWWEHPPPKLPTPPASYPQLRDLSARHARVPLPAPPAVALFADLAQAWVTGRRDGRSGGLGAAVAARRCAALAAPSGGAPPRTRRPGRGADGDGRPRQASGFHSPAASGFHSPATWRVATFSRFQRFWFAMASTRPASAGSSKWRAASAQISSGTGSG